MLRLKQTLLMLCFTILGAFCFAKSENRTLIVEDGITIGLKEATSCSGFDKSNSIQASINGHVLSIVFLENLGQVNVVVSYATGGEVDTDAVATPNGVNFYIPSTGSYIVTFTLPNGDVYYGEFEVTD